MRRLTMILVFVAVAVGCGGPDAEEIKENCSGTNACVDAIVKFCDCCPDPTGGYSCDRDEDLCAAAIRLDSRVSTTDCRVYAAASCDVIEDEGGCD